MRDITDENTQATMSVDEIVLKLDSAGRKLPIEAIREAQKSPHLIVPKLIEVLQKVVRDAQDGIVTEGQAPFFAIYLLAEFGAKEALPTIQAAVSLPGDVPFDLFGDTVTENLARIFANLAPERLELLESMIDDAQINEYVRSQAAEAFLYFVRDGDMTREQVVRLLDGHLRLAIDNEDYRIVSPLVSVLARLSPAEARETIADAYQRELVDTFWVRLEDVDDCIKGGEQKMQAHLSNLKNTAVDDTIEELRTWASFREQQKRQAFHGAKPATGSDGRRVGRNEPCPCGSGKKSKKCCGSRQSLS